MWRKFLRPVLVIGIIVLTLAVFIDYFKTHPSVHHQLSHISLGLAALLVALYSLTIVALGLANYATLRLCRIKAGARESWLITAYAAVVNFFGPLQSGPAVRGVYLKKRYNVNLGQYSLASLVYYFFWALFSGIFLLSGLLKWWLIPLLLLGLLSLYFISRLEKIKRLRQLLDLKAWYYLAVATGLQILIITAIYYLELKTVQPSVHLSQAIIYTGAANFALFVSITPAAIGFRESFLVLSHQLHHIPNSTILAASIIDRAVYVIFLVILAGLIVVTHASKRLGLKNPKPD